MLIRNEVKLLFFISTKRTNKQGKAPIYYKLRVNGAEVLRSTGIYVLPEHWNRLNKKVVGDKLADEYNAQLVTIESAVLKERINADLNNVELDSVMFKKNAAVKRKAPTIIEAAQRWIDMQGKEYGGHRVGTINSYRSRLKHLVDFLREAGHLQYTVKQINVKLGNQYKTWLLERVGSQYAKKCMHILKMAEKFALVDGHIDKTALDIITFSHRKPKPQAYIEPHELEAIEKLCGLPDTRLRLTVLRFLLQCYTGFAFADLMAINRQWLQKFGGVICLVAQRQKTETATIVPLTQKAEAILSGLSWTVPPISNAEYNAELKLVGRLAGISIPLRSHVGRHTFGMIMLNTGYSLETVSRMMGHSSIRITERIYAKILPKRIIDETLALKIKVAMAA